MNVYLMHLISIVTVMVSFTNLHFSYWIYQMIVLIHFYIFSIISCHMNLTPFHCWTKIFQSHLSDFCSLTYYNHTHDADILSLLSFFPLEKVLFSSVQTTCPQIYESNTPVYFKPNVSHSLRENTSAAKKVLKDFDIWLYNILHMIEISFVSVFASFWTHSERSWLYLAKTHT